MKAHPGPLHPTTRCTAPGMEPRRGTPVASYVAGPAPDARPLERGQPRDADTEGGNQPADKSLINRRLKRSTPGPVQAHSSTSTPATTSEQPNRELTSSSLTGVIRASWLLHMPPVDPPAHSLGAALGRREEPDSGARPHPAGLADKARPHRNDDLRLQRQRQTILFAALNVLDGTVIGQCRQRHRHQEFRRFLNRLDRDIPSGVL